MAWCPLPPPAPCPNCGGSMLDIKTKGILRLRYRAECACGVSGPWCDGECRDGLRDAHSAWSDAFKPLPSPKAPPPPSDRD